MSQGPFGGAGEGRSDLQLRLVSALVLSVGVLALTILGGAAFRLFAAALAVMILREWTAMRSSSGRFHHPLAWSVFLLAILTMLLGVSMPIAFGAVAAAFLVVLVHGVISGSGIWSALGIVYAGFPAVTLTVIRGNDSAGLISILFLFAVVWATDIAAYFAGRAIGGPRLAPSISPGKTWSGAIGGALAAIVVGVAVAWTAGVALPLIGIVLFSLLLSVASQIGDLFESAVKRHNDVKDSGVLVPGHGGVMDRVDGLIVAAIVFFLFCTVLSGSQTPPFGFFSQ